MGALEKGPPRAWIFAFRLTMAVTMKGCVGVRHAACLREMHNQRAVFDRASRV